MTAALVYPFQQEAVSSVQPSSNFFDYDYSQQAAYHHGGSIGLVSSTARERAHVPRSTLNGLAAGDDIGSVGTATSMRSIPGVLPGHVTPPVLSISPPVHKKAGPPAIPHASPAAGTGSKVSARHHVTGPGAPPAVPTIHSLSVVETFRKILDGVDIDDCEPAGEDAFLVCDLKRVWDRYTLWQSELGNRVEPFFAVKCNPDPVIIQLMARLGLGFDCASHQEIAQVLSYGVNPDKIIYANPCKASSFIRHAAKQDVKMMTFDNADELSKVKKFHPGAKMVLRILTDDSGSLCKLGLKFGAPLEEVRGLLEKAKDLDVDVIGISFHVGSGCTNPVLFADAVERAKWAFGVGAELGFQFNLLDVGGGFGGENFVEIAGILREAIEQHFPTELGVRIIAEPGRYFVAEAFEMATNIIARRGKPAEVSEVDGMLTQEEEAIVMYYINDGVYGSFNCTMFDHQVVHPKVLTLDGDFIADAPYGSELPSSGAIFNGLDLDSAEHSYQPCSIWGPTCDSIDCVSKRSYLPTEALQVGDWLRWENMGAYTICAASQVSHI